MVKKRVINVESISIAVVDRNHSDYISITDMLKAKDGNYFIEHWLRNRNTVEFLGIWESINNPNSNSLEFEVIKFPGLINPIIPEP